MIKANIIMTHHHLVYAVWHIFLKWNVVFQNYLFGSWLNKHISAAMYIRVLWVTQRFQCIQMQNLYTLILKRETESLVKIAASSKLNTHERMWRWKHIHPIIKGLLFCAILYFKRQIIRYGLKSLLLYVTFFRCHFLRN